MTHKSQKAYSLWGSFKKINKLNINKTKTKKKNWAKTFAVEISQTMTYNNAQV